MTRLLQIATSLIVAAAFALGAPLAASASVPAALPASNAAARATGLPAALPTDTGDFTFSSYDADYYLAQDADGHSTLRTVETLVAQFPDFDQNRGIIRAIPNDYDGVPLGTRIESVTDGHSGAVNYETSDTDGFTEVALGTDEYVHGTQTYVITYEQSNVVRAFADTGDDEFYWDTNGTGFSQSFGSVTARVHVDSAITDALTGDASCYFGAQGDTNQCEIKQAPDASPTAGSDGSVFTASTSNLGGGETLTVAIGFHPGTFVQVPADESNDGSNGSDGGDGSGYPGDSGYPGFPGGYDPSESDAPWWSGILPIVMFSLTILGAVAALIRRLVGPHDAKGRGAIIAQYSVPKGFNLLEAGDLVGRSSTAIAAQIVSFAVRKNVRILDYPVSRGGGDFTLQLLNADGVDAQERELLATLFGPTLVPGAVRELGVTNDALARKLSAFTPAARASVLARGWRGKSSRRSGLWIVFGMLALLIIGVVLFAANVMSEFSSPMPGVGFESMAWLFPYVFVAVICLIITVAATRKPAVITDAGAEQRDYLKGMKVYLQLAEADRFRMLQSPEGALRVTVPSMPAASGVPQGSDVHIETDEPIDVSDTVKLVKLYEKLLPYAVLWGVEREWSKELAVYYDQHHDTPDWFVTSGTFNAAMFASSMGMLSDTARAAATPTPTQSSSSWSGSSGGSFSGGSMGGGFSGGGGGGGGGGGR